MTTRREMLQGLGAAAAVAAFPGRAGGAASVPRARRRAALTVGVQLYTLRAEMRRDPDRTLARIAELGYADVEWWGSFDRTPRQLRALLQANGLQSTAAHVSADDLAPGKLDALLETAQTMGHRQLIVAWTPQAERTTDGWKRLAALLSAAGRTGAAAGIATGYHNHDFEFDTQGGPSAWSILVAETDPAVVSLELDCFWAFKAGQDPMALLRRHAGRVARLHLKDSGGAPEHRQMDVGAGVIDWPALLALGVSTGVTHGYVEHDSPSDAWETVASGRRYLREVGF